MVPLVSRPWRTRFLVLNGMNDVGPMRSSLRMHFSYQPFQSSCARRSSQRNNRYTARVARTDATLPEVDLLAQQQEVERAMIDLAIERQLALERLDETLAQAVLVEDYGLAARTRDEASQLRMRDPVRNLQTSLDNAILEERYEDAARVLAEGTLHLIGVWVGRNDERADVHGCVLSIQAGLASDRLVGSMLCSEYMEDSVSGRMNSTRVLEIFPSTDACSPEKGATRRVVSYLDTCGNGAGTRIPVQLNVVSKDEFVVRKQMVVESHGDARGLTVPKPRMLCRCCRNMILPEAQGTVWSILEINGFSRQYLADEPAEDAMATALLVPGSSEVTIETLAVPTSHGTTAGPPSPSTWFAKHTKRALSCTRCGNTLGFRYRPINLQEATSEPNSGFDGLFCSSLLPESEDFLACNRLPEHTRFTRLQVPEPGASQPMSLQGLYVGSYGSHGPEIVLVTVDNEGQIMASKMTGDPNVPAGEVTFKAFSEGRLTQGMSFPEEWCVLTAYPGKGRVAQEGYTNAVWVDGILLSINRKQATNKLQKIKADGGLDKEISLLGSFANADLGFVWNVGGRRSMVLFTRQQVEHKNAPL